ncbi:hypothetical protein HanXRQr2_Chr02g0059351 [Helianthus annuus]|uniref:Uncharacterized protein n=1 Tax=Helianthus annuus TaxID=4232 RepID=A0A9K3JMX1_HELAN|nr:hypothetical protein HanXRQr2_Chr02g0059351 [Helianthus annuus]
MHAVYNPITHNSHLLPPKQAEPVNAASFQILFAEFFDDQLLIPFYNRRRFTGNLYLSAIHSYRD